MKKQLLTLLIFCIIQHLNAQPGTVDTTYGTNGRVQTNFGIQNRATGIAIQPDGKAVVVGYAGVITELNQIIVQASNFAVARYNKTGELDSSFGVNGKVLTKLFKNSDDVAIDVVLRSDGKIIVGGYGGRFFFAKPESAEIVQYNTDGSIDSTFGDNGKVHYKSNSQIIIASIALQSDGKILLGGTKDSRFTVLRFTASGIIDSTFGVNGVAVANFTSYCQIYSIAVDANDKILMTGLSDNGRFLTARMNKNGSLDHNFGINGYVQTDFSSKSQYKSAYSTSVVVQPDNKIVVGGNISWGSDISALNFRYGVARYNSDGSADTSFAHTGKQLAKLSLIGTTALTYKTLLKPDGRIIQVGETGKFIGIVQYKSNGELDSSFGDNGISASFRFDRKYISPAFTAALQPNGKLVTAGYVTAKPYDSSRLDWSIARFNGDNKNTPKQSNKINGIKVHKLLSITALSIYPNPVPNNVTTISYTLANPEKISISLANMQGNVLKVLLHDVYQHKGSYSQQISLPNGMLNGTYTITITTASEKKMITIVK